MQRKIIFVTDTHIFEGTPEEEIFFSFLDRLSQEPVESDIVFLGDIFELWYCFPNFETEMHRRFKKWCSEERAKGRFIGYVEGNHELYLRKKYFSAHSSKYLFLDGGKVCAGHGDWINKADFWHLALRIALRNRIFWCLAFISGITHIGPYIADRLRKLFKKNRSVSKKRCFPAHSVKRLYAKLQKKGVRQLVLGHFHKVRHFSGIDVIPQWKKETGGIVGIYEYGTGKFYLEKTFKD